MRGLFRSYYKPTDDEFSKMWQEGIFSFDTNVLLNVYRYTPDTRSRLFEILQRFYNRVWIPYQVAYEYHERRLDVISDQFKAAESIEAQLSKSFSQIENELRRYKNHPFANVDQLIQPIKEAVEGAKTALQEAKSNHPNFIRSDPLLETITELFNDNVGQPYLQSDLEKLYKEIDQRYEKKIPPGYEDAKEKKDVRKYGDAILWYQIIDYAKKENKPLVFVTGERKEDWWLRHEGETIGPRPELLREIHTNANVLFYMYSTDQFMEHAEVFLGLHDHQGAIEEIREIRKQDEANTVRSSFEDYSKLIKYFIVNQTNLFDSEERSRMMLMLWSTIVELLRKIGAQWDIDKYTTITAAITLLGDTGILDVVLYNDIKFVEELMNKERRSVGTVVDEEYKSFIMIATSVLNRLNALSRAMENTD